jgi:hypothetical protein
MAFQAVLALGVEGPATIIRVAMILDTQACADDDDRVRLLSQPMRQESLLSILFELLGSRSTD